MPLSTNDQNSDDELAKRFAKCPAVAQLLHARGINTVEEAARFFHPSLRDLHDPFLMDGMEKAVDRLNAAMGSKERIMVYGDYDVDGTTAVSLVYRYLQNFYSEIDYYIPTRYDEGYGITKHVIDEAAAKGVRLIIILDCGIKAVEEIAYAKSVGIDFIICDHHVPDEVLPPAVAILNPKLPGSKYPCSHLSGCGVGYKFMQAFSLSNGIATAELEGMLDLVAVSIAADIVPMVDENRVMAYHGLRRLNSNPNMGLRAVIRTCGLGGKEITISDVIFKIGPRINASGRMQSGKEAVELLTSRDIKEAAHLSLAIDQYNRERKQLDKQITDEAIAEIERNIGEDMHKHSLVIYNPDWHKGIIGIVASRITEQYYKPSVVLTLSNGLVTGSSRSSQGFDVYGAVESTRDLLENFGGHTFAVGLSLKEENLPEFKRRFEEYVATHIQPDQLTPQLKVDAELAFADITPEFISTLRLFNPYGHGNPKPVFCTRGVTDFGGSRLVGRHNEHIKLELVDETCGKVFNAIAFNMDEHFDHVHSGKPFEIYYTIEESKHRNVTSVQLQIKCIVPQ